MINPAVNRKDEWVYLLYGQKETEVTSLSEDKSFKRHLAYNGYNSSDTHVNRKEEIRAQDLLVRSETAIPGLTFGTGSDRS